MHNDLSDVTSGQIVQAGSVDHIHFHAGSRFPTPFELPPPPGFCGGRDRELAELNRWRSEHTDRALVAVVSGPGGVGKSTLALRWLHDVRRHCPDGQLYADLGTCSGDAPAAPGDVLEWFLVSLGVEARRIPRTLAQRAALYRSMTSDRRLAVLLDDAMSVAQVRPLLPASPHGLVVVTTRWRLAGLRLVGARFLEVDPLTVADSVDLLNALVDDGRPERERPAAEELSRLCGGMPLALSVTAARLLAHPNRPLAREVVDLRGQDRLATMAIDAEPSVETVFTASYRELPAPARAAYRRCALHPGESFGADVIAAATGDTVENTERALDALVERHLLSEVGDRRFRYHDLLLVHARQLAEREDTTDVRDAVLRGMVEWYLDATVVADLTLRPTRRRVGPRFGDGGRRPVAFGSHRAALGWLDQEYGNVVRSARTAARHGWDDLAWEFCEALWGCYLHFRRYDDWIDLHHDGIPAAHRAGRPVAEARLRVQLGAALVELGRLDEAEREMRTALVLAEAADDRFTVAMVRSELATVARRAGDLDEALGHLAAATAIREVIGTPRAVAGCWRRTGEVLTELGRFPEAVRELSRAVTELRRLGDRGAEARTLTSIGIAYTAWGRPSAAEAPLAAALALADQLGSARYRAIALDALGDVAIGRGDAGAARRYLTEALEIYSRNDDPRRIRVAEQLAGITAETI